MNCRKNIFTRWKLRRKQKLTANIARNYESKKTHEVSIKMTSILTDNISVYQRLRRLSQLEKEEIDSQLKKWLANGIIRASNSD